MSNPTEETIGFWIKGKDFNDQQEVLVFYDDQRDKISESLNVQPDYDGVGPWRGYTGNPPEYATCQGYSKAIRFSLWNQGTDREVALYLTATDADTCLTLIRVTVEQHAKPTTFFERLARLAFGRRHCGS